MAYKDQLNQVFPDSYFLVKKNGTAFGGFEQAKGLTMQVETVEYEEGGVNDRVHQLPGQVAHSNLVLRKGLIRGDTDLWDWMEKVKNGMKERHRKNVTVVLHHRAVERVTQSDQRWGWQFEDAYPVQWSGPQMSAMPDNSVAIESLELAHRGFKKV